MGIKSAVFEAVNSLTFWFKRKPLDYYRRAAFMRLVRAYFSHVVPAVRRFLPLYGAAAVILLTYRCQCRCRHCGIDFYKKEKDKELTHEELLKLIEDLGALACQEVHLFGGEPLIYPDLPALVRHTRKNSMKSTLDTNGLLLDEAMLLSLKEAGIDQIGVSLDSPIPEKHDEIRAMPGLFAKAVEGVRLCVRHGIPCYISTVATKENLRNDEMRDMLRLAESLGTKVRILAPIRSGKWWDRKDIPLTMEELGLLHSLLSKERAFRSADYLSSPDIPYLCGAKLRNQFAISAYGDVMPCCYLPLSFGNVRTEALKPIVRRLWAAKLFPGHTTSHDCPLNDECMHEHYADRIKSQSHIAL